MILITGASKGIGKYLMEEFCSLGETVYGTYNSTTPKNTEFFTKVDISDSSQIKKWIDGIYNYDGKITLINCAGVNYNSYAHKADIEKWSRVIEINLIGTFRVIHSVLPKMRTFKFGRIINFSSIVAQKGIVGTSCYASSKAALWGMARSIAVENAKYGITINNLNLGYFDIGMIKEVPLNYLSFIKNEIPAGRLGKPEDIFKAVKFLMENEYVNGTSTNINGGMF